MMAKEYIEREALLKRLKFKVETDTTYNHLKQRGLESAMAQVRKAPAADVVEVKHGRWISDDRDVLFSCSECGTQISTSWDCEDLVWNFCPNCGAKMDGGDEND